MIVDFGFLNEEDGDSGTRGGMRVKLTVDFIKNTTGEESKERRTPLRR
jgi:hypothetical protein